MYYSVAIVSFTGRAMQDKTQYIEPNAGIQSSMHLTVIFIFAFTFAEHGKNISSDCANTHVARVLVPACAMVLPSEVMKNTCVVLAAVLNKLPCFLKNSSLSCDFCLAPFGFNG